MRRRRRRRTKRGTLESAHPARRQPADGMRRGDAPVCARAPPKTSVPGTECTHGRLPGLPLRRDGPAAPRAVLADRGRVHAVLRLYPLNSVHERDVPHDMAVLLVLTNPHGPQQQHGASQQQGCRWCRCTGQGRESPFPPEVRAASDGERLPCGHVVPPHEGSTRPLPPSRRVPSPSPLDGRGVRVERQARDDLGRRGEVRGAETAATVSPEEPDGPGRRQWTPVASVATHPAKPSISLDKEALPHHHLVGRDVP